MRIERTIWLGGIVHFTVFAAIYGVVGDDPVGFVLLVAGIGFAALVAFWTLLWSRRHGERPSDDTDADASDDSGVVQTFAVASLRPLALGFGITGIALGLVIGIWLTLVGSAIVASQVALLVRDIDS
jgi:hypothetical protein